MSETSEPAGQMALTHGPQDPDPVAATRAGEARAYSFGDSIDRDQVNFDSDDSWQKALKLSKTRYR